MAETMTLQQFGQSIKAKYPQYASLPDDQVGQKVLEKYPSYASRISSAPQKPVAFTPPTSGEKDTEAAQKTGAWFTPNTENASPISEGLKTVGNVIPSAINFAKGVVDIFNPVSTVKRIKQAAQEFQGLKKEVGGDWGNALQAGIEQLPRAGYEAIVPEAARGVVTAAGGAITGNAAKEKAGLETAQRALVSDPVGSIAPFIFGAKGGAELLDRKGVTKGASAAFDTGISKVAQTVTKPVSRAAEAVKTKIGETARFGIGQATGLQPETISQITSKPEAFTKEARGRIDRAGLGQEVQSALGQRSAALSETGAAYQPVRESTVPVKVSPTWIDSTIQDLTGLKIKDGKITASGSSVLREASDVRAVQHLYDLWKPEFEKGSLTANEFLNFRSDLAGLSKFERQIGKSQPVENFAKTTRARFNEAHRPQLSGLDAIDKEFSTQAAELKKLSKGFVDRNGNLTDAAINRIANATGKGKDLLLSRLEETVPGITQKIKVLKAVEDIQHASGIKVGTYGRAAIAGGAFVAGGPITAVITAILTSPEFAVPILRQYGLLKNSNAVRAVIQALKSGANTVNQLPNRPMPEVLKKDITEIKAPAGLSIEDVSGGKPSAFSPKTQGTKVVTKKPTGAFSGKIPQPEEALVKLGVDPKNIVSVKQFGSSVEGKAKPNDYDHFITVKDGSMKFQKQAGLPKPIVKRVGKNQYFIMPESEAQGLLDAMLYTGRKDQVRFYSGKTVDVTKAYTGSNAKRNASMADNYGETKTGYIKTGKNTGVFIPPYKPRTNLGRK